MSNATNLSSKNSVQLARIAYSVHNVHQLQGTPSVDEELFSKVPEDKPLQ